MHRPPHAPRINGNVIRPAPGLSQPQRFCTWAFPASLMLFVWAGLQPAAASSPKPATTAVEREAMTLYQAAEYGRVVDLLHHTPVGQEAARGVIRYGLLSHLKMGKPEEAWKLYPKLVAANRPDDPALLLEIARSFIISRVRDSQEYIRIAAWKTTTCIWRSTWSRGWIFG